MQRLSIHSILFLLVPLLPGLWSQEARAQQADSSEVLRYPEYWYDDELPKETVVVPGASAGMFFGKARFGDPFLGRYDAPYLNYGWADYRNYRINIPIYKTYDAFGNYLAEGFEAFTLEEYRTRAPQPGSVLIKGKFYQDWLQHLVIADDAYAGWTTRVTIGDEIKTTFTPLTLDMVRLNGIRLDGASYDNRATLVLSRVSDPGKFWLGGRYPVGGLTEARENGVYLTGGHWESYVGDFFVFGVSYVNLHRFDSMRKFRQNTQRGVALSGAIPKQITVRFEDDSPEDGAGGPAIFDLVAWVRSKEAGRTEREELHPVQIERSPGVVDVARHVEVNGTYLEGGMRVPNCLEYTFDVPEDAFGVAFDADVARDYRILMKQKHFYVTDPERGSGKNMETPYFIVRRAEGNVPDMSNRKRVSFDYGMPTGTTMYGMNA